MYYVARFKIKISIKFYQENYKKIFTICYQLDFREIY